ncbi:virginiamycin B lyase family protein [Falsiroseomonas sp. HW251]|uniref:Vgb family protein n=1 Tax=Falsiroseomonas sp. HW251 TaxID=3390998 RepID=UPI003D3198FB
MQPRSLGMALLGAAAALGLSGTASAQMELPPGPGRDIVANSCNSCHEVERIRAGYTPEGWRTVMTMMHNFGVRIAPDDLPVVTAYLAQHFPERPRPPAAIISGPVQATIRTWPVSTPGSRPHDPMAARDGSVWWTGQLANTLGRLDPATGQAREYPLNPYTGPHGLVEDRDGNVWFTGNFAALIGRLDPRTGEVTEYRIDNPEVPDPHTLLIARDGIVWFTAQRGNTLGRLDPATGQMRLVTSPTANSRPYGMALDSKGEIWFVEFGVNRIATIDRQTMAIREFMLPDAGARPRRLAIGPDDMIWYTDHARGFLGRLDPRTGEVKEWQSPSGPRSQPYGIVFTQGAVWYSESAAAPNTMVRFDPATERFQTWAIPGGGDIVRNMDVAPNGNPVMAHSLANWVGMVDIRGPQ